MSEKQRVMLEKIKSLKEEIEKTQKILDESSQNLEKNPNDYSARLLYLSTENHLSDLLRKLDIAEMQQNIGKSQS